MLYKNTNAAIIVVQGANAAEYHLLVASIGGNLGYWNVTELHMLKALTCGLLV